jgi:hypothetical protein
VKSLAWAEWDRAGDVFYFRSEVGEARFVGCSRDDGEEAGLILPLCIE